jgi:hypothetical protein
MMTWGKTMYLQINRNDVTSNTTKSTITSLGFKLGSAVRAWRLKPTDINVRNSLTEQKISVFFLNRVFSLP